MGRPIITFLRVYLPFLSLIFLWWYLAFGYNQTSNVRLITPLSHAHSSNAVKLAPIERKQVHRALLGDAPLMRALIAGWEAEARWLHSQGYPNALALTPEEALKAQQLHLPAPVADKLRILPQTYAAAGFLFALVDPEQIVALPQGLRSYSSLFPSQLVARVPEDIAPYQMEKLANHPPDMAIVAKYSLPTTVEALHSQGITLYTLDQLDTLEGVQAMLLALGKKVNQQEKADLLVLFMSSAYNALDNRLLVNQKPLPHTLYLNYCTCFSTPTSHKLSGQLLQRLGILLPSDSDQCGVTLDLETIRNLNPEAILLSSCEGGQLIESMKSNPALQTVKAIKNEKIYVLDEAVQEFPCQFAVLAYYDLVNALLLAAQQ